MCFLFPPLRLTLASLVGLLILARVSWFMRAVGGPAAVGRAMDRQDVHTLVKCSHGLFPALLASLQGAEELDPRVGLLTEPPFSSSSSAHGSPIPSSIRSGRSLLGGVTHSFSVALAAPAHRPAN